MEYSDEIIALDLDSEIDEEVEIDAVDNGIATNHNETWIAC
ncbi:hypothetical protein [Streptomyces sp. NPDC099088]